MGINDGNIHLHRYLLVGNICFLKCFASGRDEMLSIVERNNEELVTLHHGKSVFHDALALVREGEVRFHVTDQEGRVPD